MNEKAFAKLMDYVFEMGKRVRKLEELVSSMKNEVQLVKDIAMNDKTYGELKRFLKDPTK